MNILVTGANGYLGGGLVKHLSEKGHKVNQMDGHLRPHSILRFDPGKTQAVIHLAWFSKAGNDARQAHIECAERTVQLLQTCQRVRPYILFASSAAVYGEGKGMCRERQRLNPNCYYGHYKVIAEIEIARSKLPFLTMRLGSMMGVGETRTKTDLCVNAFARDGFQKQKVEVWDGDCYKPVIHVRDVIELMTYAVTERWRGVINVARGSYPAGDIAKCVAGKTGARVVQVQRGENATRKSCILDCSRLTRFIGLKRVVQPDVFKRVEDAVEEFRDYKEQPQDVNRAW